MNVKVDSKKFIKCKSLIDFYDVIAGKVEKKNARYDCTKITVSEDILSMRLARIRGGCYYSTDLLYVSKD